MEIYIKAWYGGYIPVTHDKALQFARALYKLMPYSRSGKCVNLINSNHLKGIVFSESELRATNGKAD